MIKEKSNEYRAIAWLWCAVCLLLLVLVFCFPHTKYGAKATFANPFMLALFGLTILGLLYLIIKERTVYKGLVLTIGLLFLAFQIWCVHNYYFVTGWDSSNLIYTGLMAAANLPDKYINDYFSWYPNNILLSFFYNKIFSAVDAQGRKWTMAVELIAYINCLISFATGILTFKLTEKLTKERAVALWAYMVFLLLIGLSPWVSIAYSDAAALVFPVLILWLYISEPENRILRGIKWFAIGAVGIFGYHLKPMTMIPVIAAVCIELYNFCKTRDYKAAGKKAVLLLLGVLCSSLLVAQAINAFGYEIDPEKRIGMAHFFAMGLNEERMGVWAGEDVEFSKSFDTVAERDRAEWLLAKERLEKMKAAGLLRQWMRKLLTCFHDGTFAWTHEGDFFNEIFENNSATARITRSFYYADGVNYRLFTNFEQAVWLSVLVLSLGGFFMRDRGSAAVMFTLLGVVLYLLLFEVRARYVYIFAPLFVVLAACGVQRLSHASLRRRRK